jgi:hypothetical protein
MQREYTIQAGDTFYHLAQRWGGTCSDWLLANPNLNPNALPVGQKVYVPATAKTLPGRPGRNHYAAAGVGEGKDFAGDSYDELEMDLAGIQFKLRRVGETRIPHEVHMLLPRAEIRKVQPQGEGGPCELQVILSNVDIVHSPRLTSEGGMSLAAATRQGSVNTVNAQRESNSSPTQQTVVNRAGNIQPGQQAEYPASKAAESPRSLTGGSFAQNGFAAFGQNNDVYPYGVNVTASAVNGAAGGEISGQGLPRRIWNSIKRRWR